MKKMMFVSILFLCVTFSCFAEERTVIYENYELTVGNRIYLYMDSRGWNYLFTYEYFYKGIEGNSIKVEFQHVNMNYGDDTGYKKTYHLPINKKKQALLKTIDNKKILITVIDDFGTLKVEEY